MKVTNLSLRNFRSHRSTDLAFDRVNIIRGPNGAGKSSIQMALELLLTGRCDVTDAGGRGAEALITAGENDLQVTATVEAAAGQVHLQMIRNRAGSTLTVDTGRKGQRWSGNLAREKAAELLAPTPVLSAVLNASRFIDMPEKEQRALLAGALATDPVEMDAGMAELLREAVGNPRTGSSVASAAEVDLLYKTVFGLRADAARELKAIGTIEEPAIPEDCPTPEVVAARIDELYAERNKVVEKRAAKVAAAKAANSDAAAKLERRRLLEGERKLLDGNVLPDTRLTALRKVADGKKAAAELDSKVSEQQAKVHELRVQISRLEAPQASSCPTCGQALPVSDHAEAIQRLRDELAAVEKALAGNQAKRTKMGDPEQAQADIDLHRTSAARVAAIDRELKTLENAGAPTAAADTSEEDEALADIDSRMAKGRQVQQRVAEMDAARNEYKRARAKADQLEARRKKLDTLVEYFGDGGPLKGALVGDKLPAFRERINEALGRFGFVCQFELDPYVLRVDDGAHGASDGVPEGGLLLRQLSESERYRFGIAFQIALAEATGVGLVVVDRADMLTAGARLGLTATLAESTLDQAFVMATAEADAPVPDPVPAGVCFVRLAKWGDGGTQAEAFVSQEGLYA